MRTKHPLLLCIIPLLAFLTAAASLRASEEDIKAKVLLAKYRDCVVTVQAVAELHLSAEVGGRDKAAPDRDVPVGGMATVIDSTGVLVSSYSFFDASSALNGKIINGPGGKKAKLEVSVGSIKQVKFLLRDGAEVPGEVVLKDETIDLIVLRADRDAWHKAGGDKLPAVDLENGGSAELMDDVVAIGLAGPALGREVMAVHSTVMVKVAKPRLVYHLGFAPKGGPAFLLDGKLLGIAAQHVYRDKLVNDIVIIPAADVAETVRQALTASQTTPQAKP